MPSKQAKEIVELTQKVRSLQARAQEKEEYIHDLMTTHYELIKVITSACTEYDPEDAADRLDETILHLIANPPTTVPLELEKRMAARKKARRDAGA